MRVGFVLLRKNNLKEFGPLIERALGRGESVTILCDYREVDTPRSGGKWYEFPDVNELPTFANGKATLRAFHSADELAAMVRADRLEALFCLEYRPLYGELRERLRGVPILFAQIQYLFDFIYTDQLAAYSDVIYGYSPTWLEWWRARLEQREMSPEERATRYEKVARMFVPVGFPGREFTGAVDRDGVRSRFGLPRAKRIVLFLPFQFWTYRHQFWPYWVYGAPRAGQIVNVLTGGLLAPRRLRYWPYARHGWNDRRLVHEVRRFCDRNDALFVVKARRKTRIRGYLAGAADRIFFDESPYPPTIVELLAVSDLCIHFYSSALMEATVAGTPWICVSPSAEEWPIYGERLRFPGCSTRPGDFYNYPGVGYSLTVPEFIEGIAGKSLADFPFVPDRGREFVQRFLGGKDDEVSGRILDDLADRLARLGGMR